MQWIKKGKEWKRQVEIRNTERVQRNGRKIEGGGKKAIGSGIWNLDDRITDP